MTVTSFTQGFELWLRTRPTQDVRVFVPTGGYTVQSQSIGTGDGSTVTFSGTLNNTPIAPSSLTVTAGGITGTDDGNGNITGTGISGTIDYSTGAYSVTFTTAPASSTAISASYRQGPAEVEIS